MAHDHFETALVVTVTSWEGMWDDDMVPVSDPEDAGLSVPMDIPFTYGQVWRECKYCEFDESPADDARILEGLLHWIAANSAGVPDEATLAWVPERGGCVMEAGFGPNDGVLVDDNDESPWQGTYSVNLGYYGRAYDERDDADRRGPHGASWAAELFSDGERGRAEAERIWAARDDITAIVSRHGGRSRVRVAFGDSSMTVSDYDHRKWSETVQWPA